MAVYISFKEKEVEFDRWDYSSRTHETTAKLKNVLKEKRCLFSNQNNDIQRAEDYLKSGEIPDSWLEAKIVIL